jgi:hypothetical protein
MVDVDEEELTMPATPKKATKKAMKREVLEKARLVKY